MVRKPSNKLIAEVSGLTEGEVGTYLSQLDQQPNGDWLAYFGNEIENAPTVRQKLNSAKKVTVCKELVANDGGHG